MDIVAKWGRQGDQRSYQLAYFNDGGTLRIIFQNSDLGNDSALGGVARTLTNGTFYHLVIVYTASTGNCEFFLNGSSAGTSSGLYTSIYNSTAQFRLGSNVDAAGANEGFFDGIIDEVGIWSRVLTGAEVTTLYNSGNGIQYPFSVQQLITMAVDVGTFTLTGIDVVFRRGKAMVASVANFILSGLDVNLSFKGWRYQSKNTSSWSGQSKNTSSWNNLTKH